MSSLKPITIYWTPGTPNPPKVVMMMEELGLPYESSFVAVSDFKKRPYTDVNPNGRVPAIRDPNNGDIVIWESGAIVQYLVETYDKDHKISYASGPERWHLIQYNYFQASGQGPYYGQAAWYNFLIPEKIEHPMSRYSLQVKRVVQVLEDILKDRKWLVGDKCTYADLSFFMWNARIGKILAERTGDEAWNIDEYPNFKRWHEAIGERPAVKRALELMQEKELKSAGLAA